MLNIEFDFDSDGLDRGADRFIDHALTPALVAAVNDTAARVAKGLGGYLEANLHHASSFTLAAGGYLKANVGDASPAALVFVRRKQSEYLGYETFGGTRTAGDPETLPGGVLVPARDSVMDAGGNLDLGAVREEIAAPDARWLALGPPGDQVLVRGEGSHLTFLVGLVQETHYEPEVDIVGWMSDTAIEIMAQEVGAAVEASQGRSEATW